MASTCANLSRLIALLVVLGVARCRNLTVHIHWFYPSFSLGGYSSEGTGFVLPLNDILRAPGYATRSLSITHHGDGINHDFVRGLDAGTLRTLSTLQNSAEPAADYKVVVCHSEPGAWNVDGGPRWDTSLCPPKGFKKSPLNNVIAVGRTMFESDRLPQGWDKRINLMDEVWVPSSFQRDIFENGGVKVPIRVLEETVDVDYFDPDRVEKPFDLGIDVGDGEDRPFVFLSVFKFEARKGYDILLPTYFETFDKDSNVLLVLLVSDYHSSGRADIESFCESRGYDLDALPPLRILHSVPQSSLASLYKAADVFVLPSRGEAWGRPHVEAMSMGVPIIATNWNGPTEYQDNNNSFPLEVESMVRVDSGPFEGHYWAEPSSLHLARIMKDVVGDLAGVRAKGEKARATMMEKFRPHLLAEKILDMVEAVVEERESARMESTLTPRSTEL